MTDGRMLAASTAVLLTAVLASCGGSPVERELAMVPGTCLVHLHAESSLPPEFWAFVPADALPAGKALLMEIAGQGPAGFSIPGISLTDLSPQILVLTRSIPPDSMTSLACRHLEASAEARGSRSDLVSARGSVLGSVATRDGWTCLYLGPAPQSVLDAWLSMERGQSLAADGQLAMLIDGEADLSLFVPSGLFAFLRVAPVSEWVPWWDAAETAMSLLQPAAARLDLSFGDAVTVELRVVRQAENVSRLRLELEDTGFTPGELLASLNLLLMAGGLM